MFEDHYHQDILYRLRQYKQLAEKAIEQISDEQFFATLDAESNSVAVIVKHIAGNMVSRWTDFLSSDGEKPDRNRDREFVRGSPETRDSVLREWQEAWSVALGTLEALEPSDFIRTVTIRGEPCSVLQAINRQLTHYAYHVGQIVFLAKHYAGADWESLSIPKADHRH
jgi:hypothetical protein